MAILIREDIAAVKWYSPIPFNIALYEQKAVIVPLAQPSLEHGCEPYFKCVKRKVSARGLDPHFGDLPPNLCAALA